MIKNLIFDFGDVFINLDKKGAMQNALDLFQIKEVNSDMNHMNQLYEQGLINSTEFLSYYHRTFPHLTNSQILDAWNFILKDFPKHRLHFIKSLALKKEYQLILLSNTNELHITWIQDNIPFYEDFKNCFHSFYLSHEIGLRKPNKDIFQFVIDQNKLNPSESLFIDDTIDNTLTAKNLGFHVWNIDETTEDVANLFTVKKDLF